MNRREFIAGSVAATTFALGAPALVATQFVDIGMVPTKMWDHECSETGTCSGKSMSHRYEWFNGTPLNVDPKGRFHYSAGGGFFSFKRFK